MLATNPVRGAIFVAKLSEWDDVIMLVGLALLFLILLVVSEFGDRLFVIAR